MPTDDQMPAGMPDTRLQDLSTGKISADEAMASQQKNAIPASAPMKTLPWYISHKKVQALLITKVDGRRLTFKEPGYAPLDAPPDMFARYTPVPGDFYVVYRDGYQSFSPGKEFLEGYVHL